MADFCMKVAALSAILAISMITSVAEASKDADLILDINLATELAGVQMSCIKQEFPHFQTVGWKAACDAQTPCERHSIFCGCFDWPSSVMGHATLAVLMNKFPNTSLADQVADLLDDQFEPLKVARELHVLTTNRNFGRTYGWSWLLLLKKELRQSPLDSQRGWSANMSPLIMPVVSGYRRLLKSLVYPVRTGTHYNTAFGLMFAYKYGVSEDCTFGQEIAQESLKLYGADGQNDTCPLNWEPNGFDYLSPCLQEASLMAKLMNILEYEKWLKKFLPSLFEDGFDLTPGIVMDPMSDKLVALHGLNFNRAINLYGIIIGLGNRSSANMRSTLMSVADAHIRASKTSVRSIRYPGAEWLSNVLVLALKSREDVVKFVNMINSQ